MLPAIFTDETKARKFLEAQRWPDGPFCPFCGQLDNIKSLPAKGSMGPGWYHCNDCRKKFTVRVGTLYERSHVALHVWLYATHLLCSSKKGMSAHQLHRMLGVTYKTAWFMAHRIREGMRETKPGPLGLRQQSASQLQISTAQIFAPKMERGHYKTSKILSRSYLR